MGSSSKSFKKVLRDVEVIGQVTDRVDAIMKDARSKIDDMASNYRTRVLIPFCSKYRLEYDCGFNGFYFTNENDSSFSAMLHLSDDFVLTKGEKEGVAKIGDDLDQLTIGNSFFACHVKPIRKKDWLEVSPEEKPRRKKMGAPRGP